MVKSCDNSIARRNTKATLAFFEFDIEAQVVSSLDMAQKRNGDGIPKAMKTILPAKIHEPTRVKSGATMVAIDC